VSSISHPFLSRGHAAVGVQFGFLLLVSMFSTEVRFLKGPSVQQMLCSDLLRERGACWKWWDLIPLWGPGGYTDCLYFSAASCDAKTSWWSWSCVVTLAYPLVGV